VEAQGGAGETAQLCLGTTAPSVTLVPTPKPSTAQPAIVPTAAVTPDAITCYTLDMTDTFGDGWNGAAWAWADQTGATQKTGTLTGGYEGTSSFCVWAENGPCYTFIVNAGYYPSEITWTITSDNDPNDTFDGGAPYTQVVCGGTSPPTQLPTMTQMPTMTPMPTPLPTPDPTPVPTTPAPSSSSPTATPLPTSLPTISQAPTMQVNCYTLTMRDTSGNGWDGTHWTWTVDSMEAAIDDNSTVVEVGTLDGGSEGTHQLCVTGLTCATLYVDNQDSTPGEVIWELEDGTSLGQGGGADSSAQICVTMAPTIASSPPTPLPTTTLTPTTAAPSTSLAPTTPSPTTPAPSASPVPTSSPTTSQPTTAAPTLLPTVTPVPTTPIRSVNSPEELSRAFSHGFHGMVVEMTADIVLQEPIVLGVGEFIPTASPTPVPTTPAPSTQTPTPQPTATAWPTEVPTTSKLPTPVPTSVPTSSPSKLPTSAPTYSPNPTLAPTAICPATCTWQNMNGTCDEMLDAGAPSCDFLVSNNSCTCGGCTCGASSCYTLDMTDTWGDGWNGASWTWTSASTNTVEDSGTLVSGYSGTAPLCGTACYTFSVGSGSYPNEIAWTITDDGNYVEAQGGAGETAQLCLGQRRLEAEERSRAPVAHVAGGRRLLDDKHGVYGVVLTSTPGEHFTISGDGSFTLIAVTEGSELTIANMTLSGGGGTEGGAVLVNQSKLWIEPGTRFESNSVTKTGGAIAAYESSVWADGAVFSMNSAANDCGAIGARNSSLSVKGATSFTANVATSGGAVCATGSKADFSEGTVFSSNTADNEGGALFVGHGSNVSMTGSRLTNNTAAEGGAVFESSGSVLIMDECDLILNTATSGSGGAASVKGRALATRCDFESNVAQTESGGAVHVDGDASAFIATSCGFRQNEAQQAGGAMRCDNGASLILSDSDLAYNKAVFGGALSFVRSAEGNLVNVTIHHCNATEGGGGMHVILGSDVTMTLTSIADSLAQDGGGAYVTLAAKLTVNLQSIMSNNIARSSGGSLFVSAADIEIDESEISSSSAVISGGGAYIEGDTAVAEISNSKFKRCNATVGGAIAADLAKKVRVTDSTFETCQAALAGGAIQSTGGVLKVSTSDFTDTLVDYTPEDKCVTLTMLGSAGTGWEGARLLVIPRDDADREGGAVSSNCPGTCFGETCQWWDAAFGTPDDEVCDYNGADLMASPYGCDCGGCACAGYETDDIGLSSVCLPSCTFDGLLSQTCDYLATEKHMRCSDLESTEIGCDCTHCDCEMDDDECITMVYSDTYLDGWDDAEYTWSTSDGVQVFSDSPDYEDCDAYGSEGCARPLCFIEPTECYTLDTTEGDYPSENRFKLYTADGDEILPEGASSSGTDIPDWAWTTPSSVTLCPSNVTGGRRKLASADVGPRDGLRRLTETMAPTPLPSDYSGDYDGTDDFGYTSTDVLHNLTLEDGYSGTEQLCFSSDVATSRYRFKVIPGKNDEVVSWDLEGYVYGGGVEKVDQDFSEYDSCTGPGGGALHVSAGAVAEVTGCNFVRTTAKNSVGGAVAVQSSKLGDGQTACEIDGSTFSHSGSGFYGALLFNTMGEVSITNTYVDRATLLVDDTKKTVFNQGGTTAVVSGCSAGKYGLCSAMDNGDFYTCEMDNDGDPTCLACPAGKYGVAGGGVNEDSCILCPRGQYQDTPGQAATVCAANTDCDVCIQCGAGSYATDETDVGAPDGVGLTSGATRCVPCAAGRMNGISEAFQCLPCAAGKYAGEGQTECYDCERGKYAANLASTQCTACESGKRASEEGLSFCTACQEGSYSAIREPYICDGAKCNDDESTVDATESAANECHVCPRGKSQALPEQSSCDACAAGKYSDRLNNVACTACDPHMYSDENAEECTECPAGQYTAGEGSSVCLDCERGKYSLSGEGCTRCSPGKFSSEVGSSGCNDCPEGKKAVVASFQCTDCETGKFSGAAEGSCRTCASGEITNDEKSDCVKCQAGKKGSDVVGLECVDCGLGEYSDNEASTSCQFCRAGRYAAILGSTECTHCEPGKFQSQAHERTCENCMPGEKSTDSKDSCAKCAGGSYSDEGSASCTLCPAGRKSDMGSPACLDCAAGSYSDEPGQASCKLCSVENNVWSDAGATECTLCLSGRYWDPRYTKDIVIYSPTARDEFDVPDELAERKADTDADRFTRGRCIDPGPEFNRAEGCKQWSAGECLTCPAGSTCGVTCEAGKECDGDLLGWDLMNLRMLAGYFRTTYNSSVIMPCKMVRGCNKGCEGKNTEIAPDYLTEEEAKDEAKVDAFKVNWTSASSAAWMMSSASLNTNAPGSTHAHADTGDMCVRVGRNSMTRSPRHDYERGQICNPGYEGPLCNLCYSQKCLKRDKDNSQVCLKWANGPNDPPSYFKESFTNECRQCTAENTALSPATAMLLVVLVLIATCGIGTTFINREKLIRWYERREDLIESLTCSGQTIFITYQILSELPSVHIFNGGHGYPDPFRLIAAFLELFQLDLFSVIHADCIQGTGYTEKLLFMTLAPIALMFVCLAIRSAQWFCFIPPKGRDPVDPTKQSFLGGVAISFAFYMIFMFLPTISNVICRAFTCDDFDKGDGTILSVMSTDYGIECEIQCIIFAGDPKEETIDCKRCTEPIGTGPKVCTQRGVTPYGGQQVLNEETGLYEDPFPMMPYAVLMLFIYPLGAPLLLLVLLYAHKEHITNRWSRNGKRSEDGTRIYSMEVVEGLIKNYHPAFWYFGIVDMYRRLSLTSFLYLFKFFENIDGVQREAHKDDLLWSLLVSILSVVIYREIGPFWEVAGDVLTYVAGWTVVLAVISLLLMDMNASVTHQYIISAAMVGINVGILACATYFQYKEARELDFEDEEDFEEEALSLGGSTGKSSQSSNASKKGGKKKKGGAISKHHSVAASADKSESFASSKHSSLVSGRGGPSARIGPGDEGGTGEQSQGYADAGQSYGGYATQSQGYADQSQSYAGYGDASQGYATQSQVYAQQSQGYADQSQGYAQQSQGYAQQSGGYAQQSAGYQDQSQGYAQQSGGYAQQSGGYAQQSAGYQDQSQGYAQQSGGYAQQSGSYADASNSYAAQSGGYANMSQSYAQQSQSHYASASQGGYDMVPAANVALYAEEDGDIDE